MSCLVFVQLVNSLTMFFHFFYFFSAKAFGFANYSLPLQVQLMIFD